MTDKQRVDNLCDSFFKLFSNEDGPPDLSRIHHMCIPQLLVIKIDRGEEITYNIESFIEPRKRILSDGTLTHFKEWETAEATLIIGNIAQRYSTYSKSGIANGTPFSQTGNKLFQFIKKEGIWKIASLVWEDNMDTK